MVGPVAMKVRLRVARRYTHTKHLRRDAEQGGMWCDQALEGGYKNGEGVCAAVGCQGIITLLPMSVMSSVRMNLASVLSSKENC